MRHGRVSQATLDDKVLRLLRLAVRVGALNRTDPAPRPAEPWTAEQAQDILRSTAASGFVLARNERALLPLDPQRLRRLAVLGPNAAVPQTVGGGSATVFPPYCVSTLEGLRAALAPDITVHYSPGVHSHTRIPVARPALLRLPDDARPGALVEFLDASGSVLGTEQRLGGSCTWRMLPDAVQPAQLATVRVTTAIRAREPGRHLIGCSGHGHFRMTIAGRPAFATQPSVPSGSERGRKRRGRRVTVGRRDDHNGA